MIVKNVISHEKTLYISDLDGTLLNNDKELSVYAVNTLNSLIAGGLHFSAATARTAASTVKILSVLDLRVPVVLMNGALVYDMQSGKYVKIEAIPGQAALHVTEILQRYASTGFMYAINGNKQVTFYESLERKAMQDFHDERVRLYYKSFEKLDNLKDGVGSNQIVYFALVDEYEPLKCMLEDFKNVEGLDAVLYRDIYSESLWYLEIHSINASKYNAVRFVREYGRYDKVIGFGDNGNDIPLFKACDECYAVANAIDSLKELATGVIGENTRDGVIEFLLGRFGKYING